MGLLTGLLTLPLAPVRGTVWLAEKIAEEAERELDEAGAVRRELERVALEHELGEIDDAELERREEELLDRLWVTRSAQGNRLRGGDDRGSDV